MSAGGHQVLPLLERTRGARRRLVRVIRAKESGNIEHIEHALLALSRAIGELYALETCEFEELPIQISRAFDHIEVARRDATRNDETMVADINAIEAELRILRADAERTLHIRSVTQEVRRPDDPFANKNANGDAIGKVNLKKRRFEIKEVIDGPAPSTQDDSQNTQEKSPKKEMPTIQITPQYRFFAERGGARPVAGMEIEKIGFDVRHSGKIVRLELASGEELKLRCGRIVRDPNGDRTLVYFTHLNANAISKLNTFAAEGKIALIGQ